MTDVGGAKATQHKRKLRIGSPGEHIRSISHEQLLDEHLVLRDWLANLAAASVLAPPSGEQKLQSGADTLHQSRNMANRRNHGFVDDFRCPLHAIQRTSEQFV